MGVGGGEKDPVSLTLQESRLNSARPPLHSKPPPPHTHRHTGSHPTLLRHRRCGRGSRIPQCVEGSCTSLASRRLRHGGRLRHLVLCMEGDSDRTKIKWRVRNAKQERNFHRSQHRSRPRIKRMTRSNLLSSVESLNTNFAEDEMD